MINDKMFRAMCNEPNCIAMHGKMVYGYVHYSVDDKEWWIWTGKTDNYGEHVRVIDVNSLGMNTGKLDSQGNMIYGSVEVNGVMSRGGDIVTLRDLVGDSFRKQEFVVEYSNTRFRFVLDNGVNKKGYPLSMPDTSVTVIGNNFTKDSE